MVDVYQTIDTQSNPQLSGIELVSGMQRVFDREVEKDRELAGAISRCFTSEWRKNQIHQILMRFIELKAREGDRRAILSSVREYSIGEHHLSEEPLRHLDRRIGQPYLREECNVEQLSLQRYHR